MAVAGTVLLVGGGYESVPGVERARALGLEVAALDGDPGAPALALADHALVCSTYDAEEAVELARGLPRLDGVLSVATDVPLTVARIGAALGLPAVPVETARLSMDKLAMKARFAAREVPTPWFAPVASAAELASRLLDRGVPLVVKPVDSRGARGVTRLVAPDAAPLAYESARGYSPTGRVMCEEFLDGPQVSTETLFVDGTPHTVGFSDRNYDRLEELFPHFVEDGGTLPSVLPPDARAAIAAAAEDAGRALGIEAGACKGDLVWCDGRPVVIEVAARLSGGWFCTDQVPLATGVDLLGAAIRVALGERPDAAELAPRDVRAVATRYLFPPAGEVRAAPDPARARKLPGVHRAELFVGPGDRVGPPTDHTGRAGVAIAAAGDREEALARVEAALRALTLDVVPDAGSADGSWKRGDPAP